MLVTEFPNDVHLVNSINTTLDALKGIVGFMLIVTSLSVFIWPFRLFRFKRAAVALVLASFGIAGLAALKVEEPPSSETPKKPPSNARAPILVAPTAVKTVAVTPKKPEIWYIKKARLTMRSCRSTGCGIFGTVYRGSGTAVDVYEWRDGWARVSEFQSARCSDGRSLAIIYENDACVATNGIVDGKFSA